MRKSKSIRTTLFLSTTLFFSLFVLITTFIASSLYAFSIGNILDRKTTESSKQVINNYENYFDNAIGVSNSIQTTILNHNVISEKVEITQYFDYVIGLKKEIYSISLYDVDGNLVVYDSKSKPETNAKGETWFIKALEEPLINSFSKLNKEGEQYYFTISKMMTFNNDQSYCVVKLDFDFSKIVSLISKTNLGNNGRIVIFDKNYATIYNSLPSFNENDIKILRKIIIGNDNIKINNEKFNVYVSTITNTTWKVAIFTNINELDEAIKTFITVIIIVASLLIILFAIVTALISAKLSNPIRALKKEMTKVENLNYDIASYQKIKGSKEVEELDKSFKQMMTRIKYLANEIIKEQENQRKSELKALQNQINPHFLYNTLDSIIYMIDINKNDTAQEMIVALSKFFRISISRGKTIIPFKDEFEHARNYLLIQKLRFGDKFEYKFEIDPSLNELYTIKLILQPIVENAIAHGLKEYQGIGKITIKGSIEGDLIHIEIIDNGYGMLPTKIQEIYDSFKNPQIHQGVGIKNVYDRLKIYYGEQADIKITSTLDDGTTIHIFIPLEAAKKHEI